MPFAVSFHSLGGLGEVQLLIRLLNSVHREEVDQFPFLADHLGGGVKLGMWMMTDIECFM